MALNSALVDRARLVRKEAVAERVQGRTVLAPAAGAWFKARLFLPSPSETADGQGRARRRQIKEPTLLIARKDDEGFLVEVAADDKIEVVSDDLGTATWQIVGDPEPLRRKRGLIGWYATLKKAVEQSRADL